MKNILVVDNQPTVLEYISHLLVKEGHHVLTAADGLSALEILKTFTPDIIFADLVMPNISGDKLCRIIRRMPALKNAFFVVLSAIAAEEESSVADFGADACIAKGPFDKMAWHILEVLRHSDSGRAASLQGKTIGREDIYQREITKKLLTSKRHYETTLNHISEGFLELCSASKIVYANLAAISIIGISEEILLSLKFFKLFPAADQKVIKKLLAHAAGSRQEVCSTFPVKLNNSLVSLKFIPLKDNVHNSILVIIEDVSRRKQLEAQLRRAQKLEALGTLAGGVAHDLNNILSGIVCYPDLILMQIDDDSPLREPIKTMKASGQKAAALVQDLLTLARRGVGRMEVVNLNDIVAEYLKSPEHCKLKSHHPNVAIKTDLETDLMNIKGSFVHLTKTIMNLVTNAAEAMIDEGEIVISTESRFIEGSIGNCKNVNAGNYVVLRVKDTGIGISAEDMNRIFEPFYTKKVMGRSGSGLGMAVVKGTVEDHSGYIDVQSTPGEGTDFTLCFPATYRKIAEEKASLPVEEYMGQGESILVIDDISEQREVACSMLTTLGYSADTVSSGEEAVEYLKEKNVDLIVLDMIMDPGLDGLDTYKKILEINPGQKAIIASGYSETGRVKEAQKLGAGVYLKKPYTLQKIGLAVRNDLA